MHYGRYTFSKNGKPTIAALNKKDRHFGQRDGLSTEDIIQLNLLYRCKGIQTAISIHICVLLKKIKHLLEIKHQWQILGQQRKHKSYFDSSFFCRTHPPTILHKKDFRLTLSKRCSFSIPPENINKTRGIFNVFRGYKKITLTLTLSWQRSISYRNHPINSLCKSMDWFLYDRDRRHQSFKWVIDFLSKCKQICSFLGIHWNSFQCSLNTKQILL